MTKIELPLGEDGEIDWGKIEDGHFPGMFRIILSPTNFVPHTFDEVFKAIVAHEQEQCAKTVAECSVIGDGAKGSDWVDGVCDALDAAVDAIREREKTDG